MPDATTIREITSPNDKLLRPAYDLLRRTFPPNELVPLAEMRNSLSEREALVLADLQWHMVVATRGGRVQGVASGTYFGSLNVGIVGYLAIAATSRTHGLGPRLRARLRKSFETDARRIRSEPLSALVGEVEIDNPWLGHLVRTRGALALDVPYEQPSVRPNESGVALALYYEPLDGKRRRVAAVLVRQLIFALWRRGYRIAKPLQHARFRAMLRYLDGRRWVGSRELPPPRPRAGKRE